MGIADIRATTVAVPLEAPLRHTAGAHWGRFVRTIVEVIDEDGLSGFGELGGGGESAEAAVVAMLPYLKGHDPLQLEQLRWKIMSPTGSIYNNRTQIHAAIEMACLDLAGKRLGVRACDLLGGSVRDKVEFASYIFYRYEQNGAGGETTADDIVAHARDLKAKHGFNVHKLKGGPMLIYSRVRLGLRPDINALATIIILTVAAGVIVAAWLMLRQQKQREKDMQLAAAETLKIAS